MKRGTDKARLVSGMKAVLGQPGTDAERERARLSLESELAVAERAAHRAIQLVEAGVRGWSSGFDRTIGKYVVNYHDGRREVIA